MKDALIYMTIRILIFMYIKVHLPCSPTVTTDTLHSR